MNKKAIKDIAQVIIVLVILGTAFLVIESKRREATQETIQIELPVNSQIKAKAVQQDDFLSQGKAWSINIESDHPIELIINKEWSAILTKGSHHIYYSHDHSNTEEYNKFYHKSLKEIEIKQALTNGSN